MFILATAARCWLYEFFPAFEKMHCYSDYKMHPCLGFISEELYHHQGDLACPPRLARLKWWEVKRCRSTGLVFPLHQDWNVAQGLPVLVVTEGFLWDEGNTGGKVMKAAEWSAVSTSQFDRWWELKETWEGEPEIQACVELQVERSLCGSQLGVWPGVIFRVKCFGNPKQQQDSRVFSVLCEYLYISLNSTKQTSMEKHSSGQDLSDLRWRGLNNLEQRIWSRPCSLRYT